MGVAHRGGGLRQVLDRLGGALHRRGQLPADGREVVRQLPRLLHQRVAVPLPLPSATLKWDFVIQLIDTDFLGYSETLLTIGTSFTAT